MTSDPRDERIALLEARLAEATRALHQLRAARPAPAAPVAVDAPAAPASRVGTLELTLQSTTTDDAYRLVAEWSRAGQLPLRRERTLRLDVEALLGADPKAYGVALGRALFEGDVRDLFAQAHGDAPARVLLAVEAKRLQALRWERLCGPYEEDRWEVLGLNPRAPASLYLPSTTDRRFRAFGRRELKALVVIASPEPECATVSHFDEPGALATVLAGLGERIPSRVLGKTPAAVGPPTLAEICRQLMADRYTLLHLVCHGAFSRKTGETAIFLDGDDGKATPVRATEVIEQLRRLGDEHGLPHFAFLSVCDSAKPEAEGALGGLAQRLVREAGVPAVLAMTERVTQETALALGQEFYPRLYAHGEVDLALAEACVALRKRPDVAAPVPALFSRLGGRALFVDASDAPLTRAELRAALDALAALFAARAPALLDEVRLHAARVMETVDRDPATLTPDARRARERALDEIERRCDEALEVSFAALARGSAPPPYRAECPFPGLRAFTGAERRFFHGRKALVDALLARVEAQPLVVVLGSSGSGKSSAVMAGVIPALRDRDAALQVAQMTPGDRPLARLQAALAKLDDAAGTLLYVDQFEEAFTLCGDAEERHGFFDAMLARAAPRHRVILTMRADFLGECASHAALREAVQRQPQLVPPMTPEELRGAIEEQAAEAGLRFETGLGELILRDLVSEPGAMPLLQHALHELWDRRRGRWLRFASYDQEIGRVKGAIARTADRVYASLDDADRARVRSIMKKLTHVGGGAGEAGGARDTRRRVPLRNLCADAASEALVARLAGDGARLLVTSYDEKSGGDLVEVAHEALIREWPSLRGWLDEARYALQVGQQVEDAARHWRDSGRAGDYLQHCGARATEVRGLLERGVLELDAEQGEYLRACAAEDQRRQGEREAAAQRLEAAYEESRARLLESYEAQGRYSYLAGFADHALLYLDAASRGGRRSASTRFLIARAASESMDALLATLRGHDGVVRSAAFSPDATRAVTAGDDATARLWDAATGAPVATLKGHRRPVVSASFSPDGALVLTASDDGTARLWDASGGPSLKLLRHAEAVLSAGFSPDGARAVTASSDRTAKVWDLARAEPVATLEGHGDVVGDARFSPDGARVVTASSDHTARVWEAATGELVASLEGHTGPVTAARFSPDGARVLTASDDGSACVWDAADGSLVVQLAAHARKVVAAEFSPDGARVLTASDDATAKLWDAGTFELLATFEGHEDGIRSAAFSPHGAHVITASGDRTVRLWHAARATLLATLKGHQSVVTSAVLSPDGSRSLSVGLFEAPRLWDWRRGALPVLCEGHAGAVVTAVFSPDMARVATASADGTAKLWEAEYGHLLATLEGHAGTVHGAAFDADGSRVVTAGADGTARLWNAGDGALLATLAGHEGEVRSASFSPDGGYVVTASTDHTAQVWDASAARPVATLAGHKGVVHCAAFSPDGRRVLTGSDDGSARVWDVATGDLTAALAGHTGPVVAARFDRDGGRVVTASFDGTARIWEASTGRPVATLAGHTGGLYDATFSPDGARAVTAGVDGTARVWDVATGRPLATLHGHGSEVVFASYSADGTRVATVSVDRTARVWDPSTGALLATLAVHGDKVWTAAFSADGARLVTASDDGTAVVWDVHLDARDPETLERSIREKLPICFEGGRIVEARGAEGPR